LQFSTVLRILALRHSLQGAREFENAVKELTRASGITGFSTGWKTKARPVRNKSGPKKYV